MSIQLDLEKNHERVRGILCGMEAVERELESRGDTVHHLEQEVTLHHGFLIWPIGNYYKKRYKIPEIEFWIWTPSFKTKETAKNVRRHINELKVARINAYSWRNLKKKINGT